MVNCKSRKMALLSELVCTYLLDGFSRLMKHCISFSEHVAAMMMSSIYCLYNIGVKCSYSIENNSSN